MTDAEHLIWADMRQHADGDVRVYAKGGRLVSGTYAGDVAAQFDAAVAEIERLQAELGVLRAQRDAALAACDEAERFFAEQNIMRPLLTTVAVRAALGVQPEGN
jgi:hypothetical protein